MKVTVSVPGKIHLMGEHAVVYGKPAVIAAINKRLTVTVTAGKPNAIDYVRDITRIVQKHFGTNKSFSVFIESEVPPGYHLGSSAAVAVGTVAATCFFLKKVWNPTLFNELAYEAEKIKHGNPSGGDNTAVTMGGFIWFRRELEFLKSIWQLPFKTKLSHFYLLDTGKPKETTGEMVAYVRSNVERQKLRYERLFTANEIQTKRIAVALKENNEQTLIDAMRKGERTLEGMGVVSKRVLPIIRSIERTGGAAKILGGGGRAAGVGYLLLYTKHPPKHASPIILGEEGIRLEKK